MILRSLGFCLVFLCAYLVLVDHLQWPSKTTNQWEDNSRQIEDFLFEKNPGEITTIIVGSSMSYRLSAQNTPIPDTVYNLALGGQSIYEGLEIVKRNNNLPKYLLIESNLISRSPMADYADGIFASGLYQLKENFKGFRYRYRPITFIQYLYFGLKNRIYSTGKTNTLNIKGSENNVVQASSDKEENALREAIAKQMEDIVDTHNVEDQFNQLSAYVNYFVEAGVQVIFFEMPTDPKVLQSASNVLVRSELGRRFNNSQFIPCQRIYPTTDGIHIAVSDANDYLYVLLAKVSG